MKSALSASWSSVKPSSSNSAKREGSMLSSVDDFGGGGLGAGAVVIETSRGGMVDCGAAWGCAEDDR